MSRAETVTSLMDGWPEWKQRLIQLSKLESKTRPNIKKLLDALDNEDNTEYEGIANYYEYALCMFLIDYADYCCVNLLLKLLFPRGHKNKEVF